MTYMSIQPLWLTHFIEILLVPEFQITKFMVDAFSYKAHFRPQIFSNDPHQGKLQNYLAFCTHPDVRRFEGQIHVHTREQV